MQLKLKREKQNSKKTGNLKTDYSFEDHGPLAKSFYRIRQTDMTGKVSVSNIIQLNRTDISNWQLMINNPAYNSLELNIDTKTAGRYDYHIINGQGQTIKTGSLFCNQGSNQFSKQISDLPQGQYWLLFINSDIKMSKAFIKMNQ